MNQGILVIDDSTLDKPYARKMELVTRHWSGKHHAVVSGINLITLLWTDGDRHVPCDYRLFDKKKDSLTKNDHFWVSKTKGARLSLARIGSYYWQKITRQFKLTTRFVREHLLPPRLRVFQWLMAPQK